MKVMLAKLKKTVADIRSLFKPLSEEDFALPSSPKKDIERIRTDKEKALLDKRRRFFPAQRTLYLRTQVGGDIYVLNLENEGKDYADMKAMQMHFSFIKTAAEARYDLEGNKLNKGKQNGQDQGTETKRST